MIDDMAWDINYIGACVKAHTSLVGRGYGESKQLLSWLYDTQIL